MNHDTPENDAMREQLRGYLLGTLSDAEMAAVAARVAADPDWAVALAEEREALALLDLLPEEEAPPALAARTLARIDEAEYDAAGWRISGLRFFGAMTMAAFFAVAMAVLVLLPSLGRSREAARRASVENNLIQIGLVFKMYANESRGERLPPAVSIDGNWVPDLRTIYPEYLSDPNVLIDPATADEDDYEALVNAVESSPPDWDTAHRIIAKSIVYTGYATKTPEEIQAFGERQQLARLEPDQDIALEDKTLYRLREGIERFYITDINNPAASAQVQSDIPVLMQNVFRDDLVKATGGAKVLFLDGHVEFVTDKEPRYKTLFRALAEALGLVQAGE